MANQRYANVWVAIVLVVALAAVERSHGANELSQRESGSSVSVTETDGKSTTPQTETRTSNKPPASSDATKAEVKLNGDALAKEDQPKPVATSETTSQAPGTTNVEAVSPASESSRASPQSLPNERESSEKLKPTEVAPPEKTAPAAPVAEPSHVATPAPEPSPAVAELEPASQARKAPLAELAAKTEPSTPKAVPSLPLEKAKSSDNENEDGEEEEEDESDGESAKNSAEKPDEDRTEPAATKEQHPDDSNKVPASTEVTFSEKIHIESHKESRENPNHEDPQEEKDEEPRAEEDATSERLSRLDHHWHPQLPEDEPDANSYYQDLDDAVYEGPSLPPLPHPSENIDESYIDYSDPNDPKQVHYRKEVKSASSPNGHSYQHSESKLANSLGANPNYYHSSSSSSHVSSSSSGYNSAGPYRPRRKPSRHYTFRVNQKHFKPYHPTRGDFPYYPIPVMPKMPEMPQLPKMYPIFPPIPALPHAPSTPEAWQNLASHGLGYGYAYPSTYNAYPANPLPRDNGYAYSYSSNQSPLYVNSVKEQRKQSEALRQAKLHLPYGSAPGFNYGY